MEVQLTWFLRLLGATTHTGTVTITDTPDVAQLKTITAPPLVQLLNDTTGALSGSAADLVLAFAGTVTTHTSTVTITDAPDVAQLKAINGATTGAITLDVTNGALVEKCNDLVLTFAGNVTKPPELSPLLTLQILLS